MITILAVRAYYREAKLLSDAATAAEKAKNNFKMARDAVTKYCTQVAEDPRLKAHNMEKLRRDLLQLANDYYEKLISQAAEDSDLQHERISAFLSRGDIEVALANPSAGETAYNQALAAATRLAQVDVDDAECQSELADSHTRLAELYNKTGRTSEAEASFKVARAIRK
ncbi:MAG: hypothetical protein ABSG53_33350, partial [Thermoguttaceae bacterium]